MPSLLMVSLVVNVAVLVYKLLTVLHVATLTTLLAN